MKGDRKLIWMWACAPGRRRFTAEHVADVMAIPTSRARVYLGRMHEAGELTRRVRYGSGKKGEDRWCYEYGGKRDCPPVGSGNNPQGKKPPAVLQVGRVGKIPRGVKYLSVECLPLVRQ